MRVPSLVELCLNSLCKNLLTYDAHQLSRLSLDLAQPLVKKTLSRIQAKQQHDQNLRELIILCEAFWKPCSLSLQQLPPGTINNAGLQYLSYATSLVQLDLSGAASSLQSLFFLAPLQNLQCLNLQNCCHLDGDSLYYVAGLQNLQCLNLQNVTSVTDFSASKYLPMISSLKSLNLCRTSVSDVFLETLTYNKRLKSWIIEAQKYSTHAGIAAPEIGTYEGQVPVDLVYLRLQNTNISEVSVPFILAFENLLLLDVCNTEVSGRSLKGVKAKYNLISLPNNAKMLARWNSLVLSTLRGDCGCSSLRNQTHKSSQKPDWTTLWELDGILLLLKTASNAHT